jgi:FkbH-like protein
LPDDPAYYPHRLADAGYFEAVSFTAEDAARGHAYAMNAQREAALAQSTDMEGYLKSLEMAMLARRIDKVDLPRSIQLINKTNQFNLTTLRRTDAELKALLSEERVVPLCVRLADRFGDNGLISVILARPDKVWRGDSLLIDTWVMSCRVLGRGVEAAALHVLARSAEAVGARALIGEYRPTAKNGLVKEHYPKLGFLPISPPKGAAPDATFWRYRLGSALPEHFIRIADAVHA